MRCVLHICSFSAYVPSFLMNSYKFPCHFHQYVCNLNPYDFQKKFVLSPFREADLRLVLSSLFGGLLNKSFPCCKPDISVFGFAVYQQTEWGLVINFLSNKIWEYNLVLLSLSSYTSPISTSHLQFWLLLEDLVSLLFCGCSREREIWSCI